jgi:hypothetical protein
VQKGKRVKFLPFAKSGKSFAIRGVWIQMAKVLAKAHLNLFSPSPIPSFPPFHTECIKLIIQNLYSPNQSPFAICFCCFLFAICFCCFLFAIGCLGPNGKKRANFLLFALLPKDPNRPLVPQHSSPDEKEREEEFVGFSCL